MKHQTLTEWDRLVAPYLSVIGIRAKHIQSDAKQIVSWVTMMPVAPDFPTEAIGQLEQAQKEVQEAADAIRKALRKYAEKEKVT